MKKIYNPYLKNSVSRNYIEFVNGVITFPVQDMVDVLSSWDGELEKWSLLDIGCGTGNIREPLFKRFNFQFIDKIKVKGKDESINVYTIKF